MLKQNILDKKYNFLRPLKINRLIRLGRKMDGGYIVDSDIIGNCDILITFGLGDSSQIADQWSFESDFIKRNKNLSIFVYDYTVNSMPYITKIWKYLKRFLTFRASLEAVKIRLKNYQSYLKFMKLNNVKFYREKITYPIKNKIDADIRKVFSRIKNNSEVILKCDIEGSEYLIIDQILEYSNRIKMLIFEFHWIDKKENIFIESVKKLQKKFEIIHIHANNHFQTLKNGLPIILEITLINKKFAPNKVEYVDNFPIKDLDYPNNPFLKDIEFSFRD
tara:strand:+ start:242 stop:1072 length:831 start_codon:yes stop_codon:yes gene_type:complete